MKTVEADIAVLANQVAEPGKRASPAVLPDGQTGAPSHENQNRAQAGAQHL